MLSEVGILCLKLVHAAELHGLQEAQQLEQLANPILQGGPCNQTASMISFSRQMMPEQIVMH